MNNFLTLNQETAIKYLAKYKYLTSSQFVKMKLYKKRAYLTKALKPLLDMKKPLILKRDFNVINGKLESFYYLTKYGKEFLINEFYYEDEIIKSPKGLSSFSFKDYHHRKATIDFHIYLNQWLEASNGKADFLHYYFDKVGNNRSENKQQYITSLNRIFINKVQSFIPDINAKLIINEKEYLILFEQHNGKDAKRLFEQLYIHFLALKEGVVSKKYNMKIRHRIIVVCEEENVKESVIKRLKQVDEIKNFYQYFLFKTNKELEEDFFSNWTLISGRENYIYLY